MRAFFAILFLLPFSFAQFEKIEEQLASCREDCCGTYGGAYDEALESCRLNQSTYNNAYLACSNRCSEQAASDIRGVGGPGPGICCAPAFIVLGLGFWVLKGSVQRTKRANS
jgi:hypothetical protein